MPLRTRIESNLQSMPLAGYSARVPMYAISPLFVDIIRVMKV